jgi:hypothetical protein
MGIEGIVKVYDVEKILKNLPTFLTIHVSAV